MSAAATRIPAEYRFPLHLEPSVETVWSLYNAAKRSAWDPAVAVPWQPPVEGDAVAVAAARLVWSHRAWLAYGRLSEGPALLVRFCLERQRESDPKYFLSVRGAEDAWHVDVCERLAARYGGLEPAPADVDYAQAFNAALHRDALDADHALDGYLVAHVLWRDGLEAALLAAAEPAARDPAARAALALMRRDRERQSRFGWLYLSARAPQWDATGRAAIRARLAACRAAFADSGVLCPVLGRAPAALAEASERAASAGLGGLGAAAAVAALSAFDADAHARLGALGIVP